jgi:hypothetical protein
VTNSRSVFTGTCGGETEVLYLRNPVGEQLIYTLDTWFETADLYLGNVVGEQLRGEQLQ